MDSVATGPAVLGRYRLLRTIGEGGMGVVHLANGPDGRRVALKVLRPHVVGDREGRARLAREIASLQRVRSSRVAEFLDADPWGPTPFVVMRFVPGLALTDYVSEYGQLRGASLLRLAGGLAEALAAVHAVGVVHRDVKPSNVLLEGQEPVLIDFGLARAAEDASVTMTGWMMGTPAYLTPEIALGMEPGPATDVHSWASTVAFACRGTSPFGRGPQAVVLDRIRRNAYDLDGVPSDLREILERCLDPDPQARPPATVLAGWLAGSPHNGAPATVHLPAAPQPPRVAPPPPVPPAGGGHPGAMPAVARSDPAPPVASPVTALPVPVPPPLSAPVATPVSTPVSTPVTTPVTTPGNTPVSASATPATGPATSATSAVTSPTAPTVPTASPPAGPPDRPATALLPDPDPALPTWSPADLDAGPPRFEADASVVAPRPWSERLAAGALWLLLSVQAVALFAALPYVTAAAAWLVVAVLVTGGRAADASRRRRSVRGVRRGDGVLAALQAPWHAAAGVAHATVLVGAGLLAAALVDGLLHLGSVPDRRLVWAGAVAFTLVLWRGPGGSVLHRPVHRAVAHGSAAGAWAVAVIWVLAALAAGTIGLVQGVGTTWFPAGGAPL